MKIPGIVGFFGVPGLRADNVEVNIVIILVGGNDISDKSSPCEIFGHIARLVEQFKEDVHFVYVCEILTRGMFKYSKTLTKDRFDAQVKKINKKLYSLKTATVISTKKINHDKEYSSDLVHLNDSGQKKLFSLCEQHCWQQGLFKK